MCESDFFFHLAQGCVRGRINICICKQSGKSHIFAIYNVVAVTPHRFCMCLIYLEASRH